MARYFQFGGESLPGVMPISYYQRMTEIKDLAESRGITTRQAVEGINSGRYKLPSQVKAEQEAAIRAGEEQRQAAATSTTITKPPVAQPPDWLNDVITAGPTAVPQSATQGMTYKPPGAGDTFTPPVRPATMPTRDTAAAAPITTTTPAAASTAQPTAQPATQAVGFGGQNYQDLVNMFQTAMQEANQANIARYEQGLGIWESIVNQYAPGGGFGAGMEAQLERAKTRDVAAAQQQMVSSGLWNTTVAAALPKKWEEEIGTPGRLQIEDIRRQRYGESLAGQAGFIERRTDQPPSMELFANLMSGAYAGPAGYTGETTGGGAVTGQRYGPTSTGGAKTARPISLGEPAGGGLYTGPGSREYGRELPPTPTEPSGAPRDWEGVTMPGVMAGQVQPGAQRYGQVAGIEERMGYEPRGRYTSTPTGNNLTPTEDNLALMKKVLARRR